MFEEMDKPGFEHSTMCTCMETARGGQGLPQPPESNHQHQINIIHHIVFHKYIQLLCQIKIDFFYKRTEECLSKVSVWLPSEGSAILYIIYSTRYMEWGEEEATLSLG